MNHPRKSRFFNASLGLALSLLALPMPTLAAGFIAIDPIAGMPVVTQPHVRPTIPRGAPMPIPPTTSHTGKQPPLLKGMVSFGLSLQAETISVEINDQVAKTHICEVFQNDTDRNLAGTYLFPLPEDTTFSSFSLHIDGKPVEGKILEAQEARSQYEEIVRRMVDPGLLEYADYKTVRARIFPIPAHGVKKVELEYTQILRGQDGMLKYQFPMRAAGQSAMADEVQVNVKLASKQGLRTIWSPSHTISAKRENEHQAKISYSGKDTILDKDFVLYYSISDKDVAANLLTHKLSDTDGYFLLTLTPPLAAKQIIAKDIVLVADTSGSMEGEKLVQCKRALKYVVNGLNAEDHFNLVHFNTDVERFRKEMVGATPDNKKSCDAFIEQLEATGGTNISDALHMAHQMLSASNQRPTYIILITDGQPTVGETSVAGLIKSISANSPVRIFDFGVGYDVNTELLNKLSDAHHGVAQYVEPDENLETVLSQFYKKIKAPVLSNVSIDFSGIEIKDMYPREVKDLFAGSQVLLMGRFRGDGKATLNLNGVINGVAKKFSYPLTFPKDEADHGYLCRLWAMRRIGHLTEAAQANQNNREIVDEIVALSKKYGIISAYTSFLVTDPSENHRLAQAPAPSPVAFAPGGGFGSFFGRTRKRGPIGIDPSVPRSSTGGGGGSRTSAPALVRAGGGGRPNVAAQPDTDFGPYMADLQRRVKRAWFPPQGNESKKVAVVFKVKRDGSISNLRLDRTSGLAAADQAALKAVENAAPFRPLPQGAPNDVDIQYTYDYNQFAGAGRGSFRAVSGADQSQRVGQAIAQSRLESSGKNAVTLSKELLALKSSEVAESKDAKSGVKVVADKTFYLVEGFWTDSAYEEGKSPKAEIVEFGSKRYFDLAKSIAGLSKYLSCGKQVIVIFNGHCYKIVERITT
jgi:Ca-activated chloride channel family protein